MKDKLAPQDRADLIKYRLSRSSEALTEATYNAEGGYYNLAVNRLYYAAFYVASALMLKYEIECNTHAGIKTMLSMKFVLPGLLDKKFARIFARLYENRQQGDYEDFIYCDEELYKELRQYTIEFIDALTMLIV